MIALMLLVVLQAGDVKIQYTKPSDDKICSDFLKDAESVCASWRAMPNEKRPPEYKIAIGSAAKRLLDVELFGISGNKDAATCLWAMRDAIVAVKAERIITKKQGGAITLECGCSGCGYSSESSRLRCEADTAEAEEESLAKAGAALDAVDEACGELK